MEQQRGSNDIRSNSYRERNERIERNDGVERVQRMERGRQQMSPVQRQERERFDRRQPEPEFRRDRRDEGNQIEWRPKDRPQGELRLLKLKFQSFFSFDE